MGAVITTPVTVALSLLSTRPSDFIFWCKWIISYAYIELFRRRIGRRFDLYDFEAEKDPYKVGFLPPPEEVALESPLPESQLFNTADEVFCYGVNSKSECLIVRVARGPDNESEAWIHLRLGDGRVYQLKETSGYQQSCCDKRAFSCGGLQMHYLSPMRRWRIFFNGVLREANSEKMVHVKLALLWRASSGIFDAISDVNTRDLATGLAKATWDQFLPPLQKLHSALNFYAQTGVIMGTASIEGTDEDMDVYLFGEKVRFLGDTSLVKGGEFCHILGRTTKNGRFIHTIEASIANVVENLTFGFIVQPSGVLRNVSDAKMDLEKLSSIKTDENKIESKFQADESMYKLQGMLVGKQTEFQCNKGWDGCLTIDCLNLQMNSLEGSGVLIKGKITNSVKRVVTKNPLHQTSSVKVAPLVVHFSDKTCQDSEVSGGKGSSLGKLTELSKDFQNFVVPNGIVVTTAAYELFLTKEVLLEIKKLENCLYNNKGDDVKVACQRVVDEVTTSEIPDEVLQEVVTNLKKAFPDRKHTHKFAVRSSATGEDTEQMSAAGQMETYLGVSGISEIMLAVKKCWASQFSYIAVQYKRQNGQVINSPMAVVIQQMISCDVAGVLFTCDPLTGNPTSISITANYGLGESVVSGSEEPDTIELGRYDDDELVVKNKIIGSKSRRIVVREDDDGTDLEDVSEHERAACCLTDEMALRLGNLAIKIEKSYRSPRDIEWGFWNKNLYIFQSRPVTSGTGETEFEIEHEFDAPLRVEDEYFTVCNVGEVMPGAMSPLGGEVLLKFFNIFFQRPGTVDWSHNVHPQYFPSGMCHMYNHLMFYCVDLLRHIGEDKEKTQVGLIGLFGRIIDDEELFEMATERHASGKKNSSKFKENLSRARRVLYLTAKTLKKELKACGKYRIKVEDYKTSQEMYDCLLCSCTELTEVTTCHMYCSESSSIFNAIIFSILQGASAEMNSDVYGDFAQLLTTCSEVESADVPAALEKLAAHVAKDIKPDDFKGMDATEAVRWLLSSTSVSGIKFRQFLQKHGHRCLKEFDLRSETWETNPKALIPLLQSLVGTPKNGKAEKPTDDINTLISQLRIKMGFKKRLLLKILIPMSRRAVQNRETSKSLLARGVDAWRKGYIRLAELMVSEGRIPDKDLLFFMTLEEIRELLSSRSPKIIAKAVQRRRRHPILDKYLFPEIGKGFPIPINKDTHPIVINDDSFSMKGIPVSQGVAKGFVRVAITLEEASLLQPGEILVTYSTDIGWSPYFPILAGVVTELGGLISHGAVVSREYGLPCIVGLHGATRQFQTGDYVLMDGNKGILQKIPKPESQ